LAWGFLNGLYFLPLLLLKRNRTNIENPVLSWNLSSVRVFVNILGTFYCPVWLGFFQSENGFRCNFISKGTVVNGNFKSQYLNNALQLRNLLLVFIVVEWRNKTKLEPISGKYATLKLAVCLAAILCWEPILITRNLSIFNFKNVFVLAFY
jgi:hypothetical protein